MHSSGNDLGAHAVGPRRDNRREWADSTGPDNKEIFRAARPPELCDFVTRANRAVDAAGQFQVSKESPCVVEQEFSNLLLCPAGLLKELTVLEIEYDHTTPTLIPCASMVGKVQQQSRRIRRCVLSNMLRALDLHDGYRGGRPIVTLLDVDWQPIV